MQVVILAEEKCLIYDKGEPDFFLKFPESFFHNKKVCKK